MEKEELIDIAILTGFTLLGIVIGILIMSIIQISEGCEIVKMYPDVSIININESVEGYYVPDEYIVLRTNDRTEEQIDEIYQHEKNHMYIHRNSKHYIEFYLEEIDYFGEGELNEIY